MSHGELRVRGTLSYTSTAARDRALAAARVQLDDEEDDWLGAFVPHGRTLRVDSVLPTAADRFAAASALEALVRDAIDGVVEISRDDGPLHFFTARGTLSTFSTSPAAKPAS
jgi:hypothetical protein